MRHERTAESPQSKAQKLVETWPALTNTQQDRLRTLLRPVIGGGDSPR